LKSLRLQSLKIFRQGKNLKRLGNCDNFAISMISWKLEIVKNLKSLQLGDVL